MRSQTATNTSWTTGHVTLNRHLTVTKICKDPLCPACGEEVETRIMSWGSDVPTCSLDIVMKAYLMEREELSHVKPPTLLRFAGASKRFL